MDDLHDFKQGYITNLRGILTMEDITTDNGDTFHFLNNDKFILNGSVNGTYKIDFAQRLTLSLNVSDGFVFPISDNKSPIISLVSETNETQAILDMIKKLNIESVN